MNKLADIIPFVPPMATPEEIERQERAVRAAAEHDARVRRRELFAEFERQIPPAYRDARLDAPWLVKLVKSRNIEAARRAVGARRVVFTGLPGAGKTSLAVAMMRARLDPGARFIDAVELGMSGIQHGAGDGAPAIVDLARRASLVLLDDLGEETTSSMSQVPVVIAARHNDDLPIWVTTGRDANAIGSRYGGGRFRRIFEGAVHFELEGPK